ncbi:hypothetical protein LTR78_010814 [Recurvomyces mirabilis]|uniref:DUF7730 domain-containing protein n=1 Tax=Recurvomyces mirabilis TaxID=574656 RepID=A0AAE0TLL3_9PEZI|nr:hypothetical protein LTR78_010814 [Recurvomyces mirabilis]
MPPKAKKTDSVKIRATAAAKIPTRPQDEEATECGGLAAPSADVVKFEAWHTSSKLPSGGTLSETESQWNVSARGFTQTLEVNHSEAFTLKPLLISEGKLKGQHVLLLAPVKVAQHFPFMELPPELRKMVYDLLLDGSSTIHITTHKPAHERKRAVMASFRDKARHKDMKWDSTNGKWVGQMPSELSIMGVNKQLHGEVASAIYGDRTFRLNFYADAHIFLETVNRMRAYLQRIILATCGSTARCKLLPVLEHLLHTASLRSLRIDHEAFCSYLWNWNSRNGSFSNVQGMVESCAPVLKRLADLRNNDRLAMKAHKLIQVGPTEICRFCRDGSEDCRGLSCHPDHRENRIKCAHKEKHEDDVEAAFGMALRAALNVEE